MKYMMSEKEMARLALVRGAIDGRYTVNHVAKFLRITTRQVKNLKKAVRELGDLGIIHGNSGRSPANHKPEDLRSRIVALKKSEKYKTTNFTHFKELLAERESIQIGYTCLSGILRKAGIESPKTRRRNGGLHSPRERREKFGELVQTDASPHDWFGTGEICALHGFQDDATGDILGLYFCEAECLQGYLEAFRQVLVKYGVPEDLYADRIGVYFVNTKRPENWTLEEQLAGKTLDKTQFGIIAEKLGCGLIPAGSPEAKGRIERLWQTLQDRLVWWLFDRGIKDMKSANAALPEFIAEHNKKYHREPANKTDTAFAPLPPLYDLDTLLTAKYERVTDKCGCFSFQNLTFKIEGATPIVKKKIVLMFSEKIGFKVCYNKKYYPVAFPEFMNKGKSSYMPAVTKRLLHASYYADVKIDDVPH